MNYFLSAISTKMKVAKIFEKYKVYVKYVKYVKNSLRTFTGV